MNHDGSDRERPAMTRRTRRSVAGSVLVVLGLVIGAVIATALQAEGRERSKAETNDGGAWLLKRDAGYVGHVNREVGEITAAVSVSDPGADFDVDQAKGVIVVHDATKGTVTVVDDSVERVANPAGVAVGSDVQVHAVDGGALIVDDASMKAWKLTREQLLSVATTDDVDPIVTGGGRTLSAATTDGHAVARRREGGAGRVRAPRRHDGQERHRRAHRPHGVGHDARHRRGGVRRHRRRRRRRLPRPAPSRSASTCSAPTANRRRWRCSSPGTRPTTSSP